MNADLSAKNPPSDDCPAEGTHRVIDGRERAFYNGYWIKTYPAAANTLEAKKHLIEALTRRLFNHTEHGLNIPGTRLAEARQKYEEETAPALKRVKAGMLAGSLFNRAMDIFRNLVELQACGVEIKSSDALTRECGRCLLEAMELGRFVLHRSGEEGIDELWGEPFRAFTVPIEEFYESRYIKISQAKRDIDLIADAMADTFTKVPAFARIEPLVRAFARTARVKAETLRTDPDIFEAWPQMVTVGERLANFSPDESVETIPGVSAGHSISEGLQLVRAGRDLVFFIARARAPMPKSSNEYIERCRVYLETGHAPTTPAPLPA
jgi:AcrR family transcriptional regulator